MSTNSTTDRRVNVIDRNAIPAESVAQASAAVPSGGNIAATLGVEKSARLLAAHRTAAIADSFQASNDYLHELSIFIQTFDSNKANMRLAMAKTAVARSADDADLN